MPNNNDARPQRTYDLIGFASLDGEPVYVTNNGAFQFLCDGITRTLTPKVDRHLESIDVASGYTCNPETGGGKYYQTNMARSFTAFFNTRSLDLPQQAIAIGAAYALITGNYPTFEEQVARTHVNSPNAKPGQTNMFPIARHLALQNTGSDSRAILYYNNSASQGRPHMGSLSEDAKTVYIYEDTEALSLIIYDLERVFRSQGVTDVVIRVVRDADEVWRLENPNDMVIRHPGEGEEPFDAPEDF